MPEDVLEKRKDQSDLITIYTVRAYGPPYMLTRGSRLPPGIGAYGDSLRSTFAGTLDARTTARCYPHGISTRGVVSPFG